MDATAFYARQQEHTAMVRAELAAARLRYKDTSLTVRRLKSDLQDSEYRENKAMKAVTAELRAERAN